MIALCHFSTSFYTSQTTQFKLRSLSNRFICLPNRLWHVACVQDGKYSLMWVLMNAQTIVTGAPYPCPAAGVTPAPVPYWVPVTAPCDDMFCPFWWLLVPGLCWVPKMITSSRFKADKARNPANAQIIPLWYLLGPVLSFLVWFKAAGKHHRCQSSIICVYSHKPPWPKHKTHIPSPGSSER